MIYFLKCEKFSITSIAHQWILCSEWVPSEWVQTVDKNRPSVNILWSEKLHVCKKQIHHLNVLFLTHPIWLK